MTKSEINKEDLLRKVQSVIDRFTKEGKTAAQFDGSERNIFPVAVSVEEGEALREWVAKEKAVNTIEIGLAYGLSTLFLCQGIIENDFKNAHHTVLDPYQTSGFKDSGLQSLKEAEVIHLIEFIAEESQIALPRFVSEGRKFDLAFVDGSHLFDNVFLDLIYLGRLVQPGGVIFADDYQAPAVARAISFCLNNLGWELEEKAREAEHHQWAVLRTPRESISRSYPHFVDF